LAAGAAGVCLGDAARRPCWPGLPWWDAVPVRLFVAPLAVCPARAVAPAFGLGCPVVAPGADWRLGFRCNVGDSGPRGGAVPRRPGPPRLVRVVGGRGLFATRGWPHVALEACVGPRLGPGVWCLRACPWAWALSLPPSLLHSLRHGRSVPSWPRYGPSWTFSLFPPRRPTAACLAFGGVPSPRGAFGRTTASSRPPQLGPAAAGRFLVCTRDCPVPVARRRFRPWLVSGGVPLPWAVAPWSWCLSLLRYCPAGAAATVRPRLCWLDLALVSSVLAHGTSFFLTLLPLPMCLRVLVFFFRSFPLPASPPLWSRRPVCLHLFLRRLSRVARYHPSLLVGLLLLLFLCALAVLRLFASLAFARSAYVPWPSSYRSRSLPARPSALSLAGVPWAHFFPRLGFQCSTASLARSSPLLLPGALLPAPSRVGFTGRVSLCSRRLRAFGPPPSPLGPHYPAPLAAARLVVALVCSALGFWPLRAAPRGRPPLSPLASNLSALGLVLGLGRFGRPWALVATCCSCWLLGPCVGGAFRPSVRHKRHEMGRGDLAVAARGPLPLLPAGCPARKRRWPCPSAGPPGALGPLPLGLVRPSGARSETSGGPPRHSGASAARLLPPFLTPPGLHAVPE